MTPEKHARMVALGTAIRRARLAAGWTQEELGARAVGWERAAVSRVELGMFSPSVDRLWRLAAALGLPLAELGGAAERCLLEERDGRREVSGATGRRCDKCGTIVTPATSKCPGGCDG